MELVGHLPTVSLKAAYMCLSTEVHPLQATERNENVPKWPLPYPRHERPA